MTNDEIKNCPFCGKPARAFRNLEGVVACSENDLRKCLNTKPFSLEEWNTRPIEDGLREEIERLKKERDEAIAKASDLMTL